MPQISDTLPALLAGAIISKDLVNKVLGPSAELAGDKLRDILSKSAENARKVLESAVRKTNGRFKNPDQVHPRILYSVLDHSRFIDDALSAEYFGGILASACHNDPNDDSAMPDLKLIESLSSLQLRLHFIIYSAIAAHEFPPKVLDENRVWDKLRIMIPDSELKKSLDSMGQIDSATIHRNLKVLIQFGLLEKPHFVRYIGKAVEAGISSNEYGMIVCPNRLGADLFLRALGFKVIDSNLFHAYTLRDQLSEGLYDSLYIAKDIHCDHEAPNPELDPVVNQLSETLQDVASGLESRVDDLENSSDENIKDVVERALNQASAKRDKDWQNRLFGKNEDS